MPVKRQRLAFILFGIAVAIFIGLALVINQGTLATNVAGVEINTTEKDAQIFFRSEHGAVIFSGDCVDVSWRVENIVAVYLNNRPTVGQGEQTLCVYAASQPTLSIITQDGTEIDYTLDILILAVNPLVNIAVWIAIVSFLASIYLLTSRYILRLHHSFPVRKIRRAMIPISVIVVITILVVEVILRIYIASFGTRDEQAMYLWSREEIQAQDELVQPMPYINYIADPNHPEHNRLGYRGPEIELPKPEGIFRIIAIGGSTTYSTGTSPEESYPALLQQILRDDYGYSQVEVINAGMTGYSSWENLINFAFRIPELEPDMIIVYAAVNDVVAREQGSIDCYRGDNALRGFNVGRGLWVEQNQFLSPSALFRFITINLGLLPNPLALQSAFEPVDIICAEDPDGTTLAERVEMNVPIYFERNMRNVLLLAQGNDVTPVLSTWAYYVDGERPEHWVNAIGQHNAITRQLAEELDIPIYDLATQFPVDSTFWEIDGIHLVNIGTREQATHYAQFLDEAGLIPR